MYSTCKIGAVKFLIWRVGTVQRVVLLVVQLTLQTCVFLDLTDPRSKHRFRLISEMPYVSVEGAPLRLTYILRGIRGICD